MRIAIIGHGRSGKDEVALRLFKRHGMYFDGSVSWQMKYHVAHKLQLPVMQAWERRHEFRDEWRSIIDEYRKGDPAKIIREMTKAGANVFSGIRPRVEFEAAKAEGLINVVAYVERPGIEVDSTFELAASDADYLILNTGTLDDLRNTVDLMIQKVNSEIPEFEM